jgi:hypothetical protein
MNLEIIYADEPDAVWLARPCAAGLAVFPPGNESLDDNLNTNTQDT